MDTNTNYGILVNGETNCQSWLRTVFMYNGSNGLICELIAKDYFVAEIEGWGKALPSPTLCGGVSAMSFCAEAICKLTVWIENLN